MQIHVTHSVKHAAAFAAIGAELLEADRIQRENESPQAVFTLRDNSSIPLARADRLMIGSDDGGKLSTLADEILARRGVTPEEAAIIGLDYARAALHNRGAFLAAALSRAPLAKIQIPGRGQFIYRTDQTKQQKRAFLRNT